MKRFAALIMAILLTLLLAVFTQGCNNDTDTKPSNSGAPAGSNSPSAPQGSISPTGNDDPWAEQAPVTFFLYAPDSFDPEKKDYVTNIIEEKFNMAITFDIPPLSNYMERLNLMFATGDIADLFSINSGLDMNVQTAIGDGLIMDLTDYVKNTPNLLKYTYDISFQSLTLDGKLYGIPRMTMNRVDGLWVRQDWLDNLGMTVDSRGVTLAEFTELLRAFTEDDPDGNGLDDTYGLVYWASGYPNNPVGTAFNLIGWQPDGQGGYYDTEMNLTDDNYVDSLLAYGALYQAGYIYPESIVDSSVNTAEIFQRGIAGVYGGFPGGYLGMLDSLRNNNPEADLTYIAGVKGADGKLTGRGYDTGLWIPSAISAKSPHVARIIAMIEWILSDEGNDIMIHGVEGVHYTVVDGAKVFNEAFDDYARYKGYWPSIVRRVEPANFITPKTDPAAFAKIEEWMNYVAATVVPSYSIGFQPQAALKLMDMGGQLAEMRVNLIIGNATKEEFKALQKQFYEQGYNDFVAEMNEYIKDYMSKKG